MGTRKLTLSALFSTKFDVYEKSIKSEFVDKYYKM